MVKAVFLVLALMIVVAAIIVLVNFVNRPLEEDKKSGMQYDPKTGVYFNPESMDRSEQDGIISFRSKDEKNEK